MGLDIGLDTPRNTSYKKNEIRGQVSVLIQQADGQQVLEELFSEAA